MFCDDVSEHTKSVFEKRAWEESLERARQRKLERQQEDERQSTQVVPAPDWDEVDRRIDEKLTRAVEIIGGNVGVLNKEIDTNLKCALDQRDRAIEQLSVQTEIALDNNAERQIAEARQMQLNFENKLVALQLKFDKSLNEVGTNLKRALDHAIGQLNQRFEVEIGLGKKLARAERQISAACERQPNFESELASLREENAKQAKLILRLRGQTSQLEFAQKQIETEQTKNRQQVTLTAAQLSTIGGQTRQVLEELRANGIDFEEWTPSGLAS